MSEAMIQIVDENDLPVRAGTMDEAQLEGLWHRIVRVMVFDDKSQLYLLQQVKPNPYYNGGLWNTTASGHVDEGESYLDSAVRETREEMGITDLELVEFGRYKAEHQVVSSGGETRIYRRHNVTFVARVDQNGLAVQHNPEEVAAIGWFSLEEMAEMQENDMLTGGLTRFLSARISNGD